MITVFKDVQLEEKFSKDGFVKIPFLNQAFVKQLLETYKTLSDKANSTSSSPKEERQTEISIFNPDKDFTAAVHKAIISSFEPTLQEKLYPHKPVMGNFVYKNPNETKDFQLHQDWSFSDEKKHRSITIWCPLVDTTNENGTIHVIKRSHLFEEHSIRGSHIGDAANKINSFIKKNYNTGINAKAGEAVIMDTRLYHFSPPNISNSPRPVALLTMVPEKSPIFLYYKENQVIEKFEIDSNFMCQFNINQKPTSAKNLGALEYQTNHFNRLSFHKLYSKFNPDEKKNGLSFLEKIRLPFSN